MTIVSPRSCTHVRTHRRTLGRPGYPRSFLTFLIIGHSAAPQLARRGEFLSREWSRVAAGSVSRTSLNAEHARFNLSVFVYFAAQRRMQSLTRSDERLRRESECELTLIGVSPSRRSVRRRTNRSLAPDRFRLIVSLLFFQRDAFVSLPSCFLREGKKDNGRSNKNPPVDPIDRGSINLQFFSFFANSHTWNFEIYPEKATTRSRDTHSR